MQHTIEIPQGYKKSKIGLIPVDWNMYHLSEIITKAKLGGNYENSESHSGLPLIKMGNILRGKVQIEDLQYIPTESEYNDDDLLKEGDLLFNTRNTLDLVGKVAIWRSELPMALYNSNLLRLEFDKNQVHSNYFMNYLMNSHYAISQLRGFATGTTSVAAIYSRDLNLLNIALPPLSEQQKIAEILSTWDQAISTSQKLIDELKLRNKGLARQLLTGKKRLKGFEGEWKEVKVGDITEKFSKRNKSLINARIYSVTNYSGFVLQSEHFSRELAGEDLTSYKIISKGEFAYNPARINVGSIAYFDQAEKGIISSLYVCFRTTDQVIDRFISYWIGLEKTIHDFGRFGEGGVRVYLWYDLFASIKIKIPSIDEQVAIVSILDKADMELKLYQKQLDTLKEQKKGLMQKLLTGEIRVNIIKNT